MPAGIGYGPKARKKVAKRKKRMKTPVAHGTKRKGLSAACCAV